MDEFGLSYDITDLAASEAEVRVERERWAEYTRVVGIQPERSHPHILVNSAMRSLRRLK